MCKDLEVAKRVARKTVQSVENFNQELEERKMGRSFGKKFENKIEMDFYLRIEKAESIESPMEKKFEIARAEEIRKKNLTAYKKAKGFLEILKNEKTLALNT